MLLMTINNRQSTRRIVFSVPPSHAVAIHYLHYNFARIHRTLRVTPAMAAGISDHVWSIEEIVGLLDAAQKTAA
jgi:hypothetical protein